MTLASLRQQDLGIRAIADVLARSPSTISRELRRNACGEHYASVLAHDRCQQRRLWARPMRKLDAQGVLFGVIRHCLGLRCSPEQIALTLASINPKGHTYCVSSIDSTLDGCAAPHRAPPSASC